MNTMDSNFTEKKLHNPVWNPSLLALTPPVGFVFSSSHLLADTIYTNAAIVIPFGIDTIALNVSSLQTNDVERHISAVTPNAIPDGYFGQSQEMYLLSVAHSLSESLLIGLSARYHHRRIDRFDDQLYTADIGLAYIWGPVRAGTLFRNVWSYKTGDTQDDANYSIEMGLSLRLLEELTLALDADQLNRPNPNLYAGIEYDVIGLRKTGGAVSLRAGSNAIENSVGLGIMLVGFEINYAYIMKSMENQHRFSLNINLGDKP